MTPKEKATELSNKYFEQFLAFGQYLSIEKAKQCALIAVDEILHLTSIRESWFNVKGKYEEKFVLDQYWVEVKKEIEAL